MLKKLLHILLITNWLSKLGRQDLVLKNWFSRIGSQASGPATPTRPLTPRMHGHGGHGSYWATCPTVLYVHHCPFTLVRQRLHRIQASFGRHSVTILTSFGRHSGVIRAPFNRHSSVTQASNSVLNTKPFRSCTATFFTSFLASSRVVQMK